MDKMPAKNVNAKNAKNLSQQISYQVEISN